MRQTQVQVDLKSIRKNVQIFKELLKEGQLLMTVLKANAYGMGAEEVGKAVLEAGADWIAVAMREEAEPLREAGIKAPILVLGYTDPSDYRYIIEEEIRPAIFRTDIAKGYSKAATALCRRVKVHIKVNTGLNRFGFPPTEEGAEQVAEICGLPNLEVEGIFTHFAAADIEDQSSMLEQYAKFEDFLKLLKSRGIQIPITHCANTPATMRHGTMGMKMARIASSIYGEYPSKESKGWGIELEPAVRFRTILVHMNRIPKGTRIGYSFRWTATRETLIGVVPVGYVDLYTRESWDRIVMLIHGQRVPAIGRLNMDMIMIDLTDVEEPALGDEVVIMGRQGEENISVEEVGEMMGTNNYETLVRISQRVPRLYLN